MQACEELGIQGDANWLGYADDLAVKSEEVNKAETAFHQLQAACAFVGLHCNIEKTECMAVGVIKPAAQQAKACKERIQVTFEDGKFEGWLIDWSGRGKVASETELELDIEGLQQTPSHLIIYDPDENGHSDITAIQMGKNGWLTDPDGDKHRCKLLGSKEFIDDKQNNNRCDKCNAVFSSERALKSHKARNCRIRQDMSADEQAKLRRKRENNANIAGRKTLGVEQIRIKDALGKLLQAVAEFRYLGTMVSKDGTSTREINRRLGIALGTMVSLNKLWADSGISTRLKCQLYKALVMTILLYNGECWNVKKQDIKKLEGFHFRCLRRLTRKLRRPELGDMEIDKASKKDVFGASRMPSIEELLREKRLRWLGHLMREDDDEPAKQTLWREKENKSEWFRLVAADLASRRLSFERAQSLAGDKSLWRRLSSAIYEQCPSTNGHFKDPSRRRR